MMTFIVVFAVMSLAVAAMAVGVAVTGREIKGTCGGINNFEGGDCELCGASQKCDAPPQVPQARP